MDIEDEMSAYFQNYKSVTDEVEVLKEMAEEYKGQAEEYKEKLQEKEAQIVSSMKTMLSFGIPVEKIAESFNKEVNEVKQMLGI
jgi:phenylalanyl-tRNA synthetase alpha subunit